MTIASRTALFLSAAAIAAGVLPAGIAAAGESTKTVVLACADGWRGSAGGTYGGVSFSIFCDGNRALQPLTGVVGTAYSIRVGAESSSIAVDCFFPGDADVVNESCGQVRLRVR